MAYRVLLHTLPLLTTFALACGPGKDTTADDSSTQATTADDATAGSTTGPTTGATEPTTGQTTDPPMTASSDATEATTPATEATSATSGPTSDPTSDVTTDATTGGPACPDPVPEEGAPCENEGQFCGGPCDDPCSFCNISGCENGVWTHLEVFPANCLDCDSVCDFVVPAGCAGGPPDKPACVAGCMDSQGGECKIAFNQMLACIGDQPTFTCDAMTRPTVVGCETQFDNLYQCMNP